MKLNIGYKVVRIIGDKLYSAIIDDPKFKIEYKVNQLIKPFIRYSRILAFSNLQAAKMFLIHNNKLNLFNNKENYYNLAIYRSILFNPKPVNFLFQFESKSNMGASPYFISKNWGRFSMVNHINTPKYSVGCTQIQLVEKM